MSSWGEMTREAQVRWITYRGAWHQLSGDILETLARGTFRSSAVEEMSWLRSCAAHSSILGIVKVYNKATLVGEGSIGKQGSVINESSIGCLRGISEAVELDIPNFLPLSEIVMWNGIFLQEMWLLPPRSPFLHDVVSQVVIPVQFLSP